MSDQVVHWIIAYVYLECNTIKRKTLDSSVTLLSLQQTNLNFRTGLGLTGCSVWRLRHFLTEDDDYPHLPPPRWSGFGKVSKNSIKGWGSSFFVGVITIFSYSRGEGSWTIFRHILFFIFCFISYFKAFWLILSNDKIPDDMAGPLELLRILGV